MWSDLTRRAPMWSYHKIIFWDQLGRIKGLFEVGKIGLLNVLKGNGILLKIYAKFLNNVCQESHDVYRKWAPSHVFLKNISFHFLSFIWISLLVAVIVYIILGQKVYIYKCCLPLACVTWECGIPLWQDGTKNIPAEYETTKQKSQRRWSAHRSINCFIVKILFCYSRWPRKKI